MPDPRQAALQAMMAQFGGPGAAQGGAIEQADPMQPPEGMPVEAEVPDDPRVRMWILWLKGDPEFAPLLSDMNDAQLQKLAEEFIRLGAHIPTEQGQETAPSAPGPMLPPGLMGGGRPQ